MILGLWMVVFPASLAILYSAPKHMQKFCMRYNYGKGFAEEHF